MTVLLLSPLRRKFSVCRGYLFGGVFVIAVGVFDEWVKVVLMGVEFVFRVGWFLA